VFPVFIFLICYFWTLKMEVYVGRLCLVGLGQIMISQVLA
jgi:hypothetical protein